MANVKFTDKQWERAKEYLEAGLSLSQITEKTGIDKAALSRRAKQMGWVKNNGEKQQLISDAVRVKAAKSTLNSTALSVHEELVDERTRQIQFFNSVAIQNVQEAMRLPCESQQDFKFRAETINKGREVVLGKTPDTAIQINTNSTSASSSFSDSDLMREISDIRTLNATIDAE